MDSAIATATAMEWLAPHAPRRIHLRATMRTATDRDVENVLAAAAAYIGETAEIERLDGGDIVCGTLFARPIGGEE